MPLCTKMLLICKWGCIYLYWKFERKILCVHTALWALGSLILNRCLISSAQIKDDGGDDVDDADDDVDGDDRLQEVTKAKESKQSESCLRRVNLVLITLSTLGKQSQ